MPKFRKNPVVIEAVQFTKDIDEIKQIFDPMFMFWTLEKNIAIETLEGTMIARK